MILPVLWSLSILSTVKHGSFLFAHFHVQRKNLKTVHALWAVCYFSVYPIAIDLQ